MIYLACVSTLPCGIYGQPQPLGPLFLPQTSCLFDHLEKFAGPCVQHGRLEGGMCLIEGTNKQTWRHVYCGHCGDFDLANHCRHHLDCPDHIRIYLRRSGPSDHECHRIDCSHDLHSGQDSCSYSFYRVQGSYFFFVKTSLIFLNKEPAGGTNNDSAPF